MKGHVAFIALIGLVGIGALILRGPQLGRRPMHGDEAINAVKFRGLYERGQYTYDPHQFHGPSLYYLTLPFVPWFGPSANWLDFNEATYRRLSVACGVALVLLVLLVGDGLGRVSAWFAAVLTALSPAMVFYSRYYIHEMPLVLFTFGAIGSGWRFWRTGRVGWVLVCALCLAMMHTTKETCVIVYFAMLTGLALSALWGRYVCHEKNRWFTRSRPWLLVSAAAIATAVSIAFFSSFFTHARGPLDSLLAYTHYVKRAGDSIHIHPWFFYLKMFFFTQNAAGPFWTEGLIMGLALIGGGAALSRRAIEMKYVPLARFTTFFTLAMVIVYSAIPYKTPWTGLGMLHGLIILAGIGATAVVRAVPMTTLKVVAVLMIAGATWQLGQQAAGTAFRFSADQRNPYIYAHPTLDMVQLVRRVDELSSLHPEGRRMSIQVVANNYWPLPWYLRRFEHAGYWDKPPERAEAAVLIVEADKSSAVESAMENRDAYSQGFPRGLRHGVIVMLYVENKLWERFMDERRATSLDIATR